MEINQWKIRLVQALLQCEDPEVLTAIEQLLELGGPKRSEFMIPDVPDRDELSEDTLDLQQSIDELLDPNE